MKRILITGASSGIGAATALHLDRSGMQVFAAVRTPGDGPLASASGRLQEIALDVTDAESIAAAMAVVSRAGRRRRARRAGQQRRDRRPRAARGARRGRPPAAAGGQRDRAGGGDPGRAAAAASRGWPGRVRRVGRREAGCPVRGPYHASKFAIEAIADVWRQELEPEELAVILVEPSAISTPIWDKAIERLDALISDRTRGSRATATAWATSVRACAARTSTARRRRTSRG